MFMDDDQLAGAINETASMFNDLCDYQDAHPNDTQGLNERFGELLHTAMDLFAHDVDQLDEAYVNKMFLRQQGGIRPPRWAHENPPTVTFSAQSFPEYYPTVLPILIVRYLIALKRPFMPLQPSLVGPVWTKFVRTYGPKVPKAQV